MDMIIEKMRMRYFRGIVSGEIDLSVGACYGLSAIVAGLAMVNGFTIWSSILIALAAGLLVGILNGLLVILLILGIVLF